MEYKITYTLGDSAQARLYKCNAESEGDACERFDEFADGLDDFVEFVSCVEA